MKTEKKLIAFSIISIIIGISSVVPLVFLMNTPSIVKADTTNEPWFSIEIPYSYWVTSDGMLDFPGDPVEWQRNESDYVSHQHMIVFNVTLNADTKNQPAGAQFEYYQIDISSDKGLIKNMRWTVGTNSTSSFEISGLLKSFSFHRNEWFDTRDFEGAKFGGGGGFSSSNWTTGQSKLWPEAGAGTGTIDGSGSSSTVSMLREAETIFIKIYRIGWVTFTDNSTEVTLANNEVIEEIQLEKHGEEGWLYNKLVPEEQLSTVDLTDPIGLLK